MCMWGQKQIATQNSMYNFIFKTYKSHNYIKHNSKTQKELQLSSKNQKNKV